MENSGAGRPSRQKGPVARQDGEDLGLAALVYLAAEPDRLQRFLGLSGLGPDNLRAAAADPGFLASVLDYILGDEPLLIGLATEQGLPPERIAAARRAMDSARGSPRDGP